MPKARDPLARLLEKTRTNDITGCWDFNSSNLRGGYGRFWFNGRSHLAHRVSWQLYYGAVPAGLDVLHTCDNPRCVNPAHLWLGTHSDNMRDCEAKGRRKHSLSPNHPLREYQKHGEGNPNAKLTEKDVLSIRADTRSLRQIARAFGISHKQATNIKRRLAWAHLAATSELHA